MCGRTWKFLDLRTMSVSCEAGAEPLHLRGLAGAVEAFDYD